MDTTDFIKQTLTQASHIAQRYFGNISSITKDGDNNQVLTEADLAIGKYIVAEIQKVFPADNIIDEEAGVVDKKSNYTWVVDPIDGTSNFAAKLPTYGIMIGLLERDLNGTETPIAGGIALPAFDELYLGGRRQPATKNGRPILVSSETELKHTLVAYGIDGHQEAPEKTHSEIATLAKIVLAIRNLRTTNSAYDMAHACDGAYGLYLNQTTKIWDNVAMQAVIEAAGGTCTDFFGNPLDYSNPLTKIETNYTICAGAPSLHSQIQAIIR